MNPAWSNFLNADFVSSSKLLVITPIFFWTFNKNILLATVSDAVAHLRHSCNSYKYFLVYCFYFSSIVVWINLRIHIPRPLWNLAYFPSLKLKVYFSLVRIRNTSTFFDLAQWENSTFVYYVGRYNKRALMGISSSFKKVFSQEPCLAVSWE